MYLSGTGAHPGGDDGILDFLGHLESVFILRIWLNVTFIGK
jgi:hypothetical protein